MVPAEATDNDATSKESVYKAAGTLRLPILAFGFQPKSQPFETRACRVLVRVDRQWLGSSNAARDSRSLDFPVVIVCLFVPDDIMLIRSNCSCLA